MELRPRPALVDIGSRVAEPRARSGGKKAAVKAAGAHGQEPGTRPVLAKALEERTREEAVKKVLSPVPKTRSQPEPIWSLSLQLPWRHLDVPHQQETLYMTVAITDRFIQTPTLQYHMSYTERDLLPVTQHIAKSAVLVNEGITRHVAIKKKYSTSKNIEISSSEELKSSYSTSYSI
ncbi:hypothetical protein AV530_008700 [Patagioenas fasciata monilis]|uniref:Cyclin C-terminal domain-containing protein n=1 Tax=Patagioenas fasciata monilis TaxID=372326 RepID=A0A1V4L1K2_PATFA|nr:hypothetical protein AV530_008700 [Patagioenas fasciata monilis]